MPNPNQTGGDKLFDDGLHFTNKAMACEYSPKNWPREDRVTTPKAMDTSRTFRASNGPIGAQMDMAQGH